MLQCRWKASRSNPFNMPPGIYSACTCMEDSLGKGAGRRIQSGNGFRFCGEALADHLRKETVFQKRFPVLADGEGETEQRLGRFSV